MLRALALATIFGLFSVSSGFAQAQTGQAEPAAERYNFQVTEGGVLRFDSRTGEISQCTIGAAGPVCRAAPDERTAFENEIARLQAENAALKKALANRGDAETPPTPPGAIPEVTDKSPAPSTGDEPAKGRMRTAVDTAWRNLVALMSRLKGALQ